MNKLFLPIFILFTVALSAQPVDKVTPLLQSELASSQQGAEHLVWVEFTDKGPNTRALLRNPESVVSRKSVERRELRGRRALDYSDLPVYQRYIAQLESAGFTVKRKSRWFNSVSLFTDQAGIRRLSAYPFVKSVDKVALLESAADEVVEMDKPLINPMQPEGVTSTYNYGPSYDQMRVINAIPLHDMGITGQGVTVCVLDAGFNLLEHEVFNSLNIIAAYDFVNNDPDVDDGTDMGSGSHGTKVLSLIGGFKEGQLVSPAFNADYILAKTENTDSETPVEEDNWIAAVEWADSIGVDITTTSLSYLGFDDPYPDYTWQDMDGNTARITIAADLMVAKGIHVFVAASNNGFNPDHNTLGAPADGDSVVAVGSVNADSTRSSFSSVGNTIDGRIKPDIMTMGSGNIVASSFSPTGYSSGGGTSYACPMAAGVAAMLLSQFPQLTPMELLDVLKTTATNSAAPNREYGWGIINALAAYNSVISDTDGNTEQLPNSFQLEQNYPNPFNPATTINFNLTEAGYTELAVYNILGQQVALLISDNLNAGAHTVRFTGEGLSSGIYIARLTSAGKSAHIKMNLLK